MEEINIAAETGNYVDFKKLYHKNISIEIIIYCLNVAASYISIRDKYFDMTRKIEKSKDSIKEKTDKLNEIQAEMKIEIDYKNNNGEDLFGFEIINFILENRKIPKGHLKRTLRLARKYNKKAIISLLLKNE